jgi:hypothetical protein
MSSVDYRGHFRSSRRVVKRSSSVVTLVVKRTSYVVTWVVTWSSSRCHLRLSVILVSNHQNHTISRNFDLAIIQILYDFDESQKSANYVKSYAFFVSLKRHIKIIHSLYDFSQSPVCPETRHSRIYMFRDAPVGHIVPPPPSVQFS